MLANSFSIRGIKHFDVEELINEIIIFHKHKHLFYKRKNQILSGLPLWWPAHTVTLKLSKRFWTMALTRLCRIKTAGTHSTLHVEKAIQPWLSIFCTPARTCGGQRARHAGLLYIPPVLQQWLCGTYRTTNNPFESIDLPKIITINIINNHLLMITIL